MKARWAGFLLVGVMTLTLSSSAQAQFAGGTGTENDPYLIRTADHLRSIRDHLGQSGAPLYYRQTGDIDLAGLDWLTIASGGTIAFIHYDGGSNRISNLRIAQPDVVNVGLFGGLIGSVRNLQLVGGRVEGKQKVGSVVGNLSGGLIEGCESRVEVSGEYYVGGLVGEITSSTVRFSSHRSAEVVASGFGVGGLIGRAAYDSSTVQDCFAASPVEGRTAGGLIGDITDTEITVSRSYWDKDESFQSTSAGGGAGLETEQMMQRGSFTNWDFSTVWQLYSGKSYPYLRAQAQEAALPILTPGSGDYTGDFVTVTATCATAGATIHYTIGRTAPTDETTNTVVSGGSIDVPIGQTLNTVAWVPYLHPSAVSNATYHPAPPADDPVADQPAGEYPGTNLVVVLSTTTTNATIHYTTNGDDPSEISASVASGGSVDVPIPSVLKARAYRSDLNRSGLLEVIYTNGPPVATPAFNPDGGAHPGSNVAVTVSCATDGAWIRYTTDGSEPTKNSLGSTSNVVVTVPVPGTLKARAFHVDLNPSEIRTAVYSNAAPVATPVFDPNGGTFAGSSVSVMVTCATADAEIRYTTDGNDPTEASLGVTSGDSVTVPVLGTLKARAYKSGLNPSAIQTALYENAGDTATPTFNPDAGAIAAGNVKVTISSTTPGAIIYYTTDGSDPSETSASGSSGMVVTVPVPAALKAKAWADGLNPSAIKLASYTTADVVATPTFTPDGASTATQVTLGCATAGALIHYTTNGVAPTQADPSVSSGGSILAPSPSTLKAKAFKTGLFSSPVKTAYYGDFAGGSGTEQDPFRIATALHLDKVRDYLDAHFVMIADIDLGVVPWSTDEGWLPIGADYDGTYHNLGLAGTFDGQGHVISNLFINRPSMNETALFGFIDSSGRVLDLGIVSGTNTGHTSVGGIVGYNYGSVLNCFSQCDVVGVSRTGGLVGDAAYASLCADSYATGDVSASGAGSYFGGFAGYASQATIERCYAVGVVTATSGAGGLIGGSSLATVSSSYWDTEASELSGSAGGDGKPTAEMKQQATFTGWDFDDVWRIDPGVDYPRLQVFDPAVSSSPPDAWLIRFYGSVAAAPEFSMKGDPLLWEYIAGTDPTDPDSHFIVQSTGLSGAGFTFGFQSVTGRVYRVLLRTSLKSGDWQPAAGVAEQDGTGAPIEFTLPAPSSPTFYRIGVSLAE